MRTRPISVARLMNKIEIAGLIMYARSMTLHVDYISASMNDKSSPSLSIALYRYVTLSRPNR